MSNRNRKFFRDFSIYAIGNLGSKLITFLMVPLYTYFVTDPSDFGRYDLCFTFCLMMMPLVTMQLREGSFRFLLGTKDPEVQAKITNFVYRCVIGTNSLVLVTALGLSLFSELSYVWPTAILLMSMSIYEIQAQIIRGLGDNKTFVLLGLITSFGIGLFSILFVAFFKFGVYGIFLANILSRLVAMIIAEIKYPTITEFVRHNRIDRQIVTEILKFSLPLIPTAICWWLTTSSNRYFIQHFCGLDAVGVYAVASKFSSIVFTLSIIFYQTWQETAITQYKSPDKGKFFSKIFNTYLIVLAVLLIGYSFAIKVNYGWLVGPNYQSSSQYVYLLGIGAILYAISAFFELGYQCAKDTKQSIYSVLVTTITNLSLNFILVPQFGIYGAIITSIISYLVLISYRWIETNRRYYQITPQARCVMPLLIAAISAIPFTLIDSLIGNVLYPIAAILLICLIIPRSYYQQIFGKLKSIIRR